MSDRPDRSNEQPQIPERSADQEKQTFHLGEMDLTFEQAWRVADGICRAGMAPKGMNNPGAVLVVMQAARQLDIPTHWALSNITFTNGRLGIMGDLAKALVRRAGVLEPGTDFEVRYEGEPYTLGWTCIVSVQRKGMKKRIESAFSLGDAQRAGLMRLRTDNEGNVTVETHSKAGGWGNHGSPWTGYTKRMMYYRALGFLLRDEFSDVLLGLAVQEELDDYRFSQARDVTPSSAGEPAEAPPLGLGPGVQDPMLADLLGARGEREPVEVAPTNTAPQETEAGSRLRPEESSDDGQGSLL